MNSKYSIIMYNYNIFFDFCEKWLLGIITHSFGKSNTVYHFYLHARNFARERRHEKFLAMNKSMPYGLNNNMGLDKLTLK